PRHFCPVVVLKIGSNLCRRLRTHIFRIPWFGRRSAKTRLPTGILNRCRFRNLLGVFWTDDENVGFVPLPELLPERSDFSIPGVGPHARVGDRRLACAFKKFKRD